MRDTESREAGNSSCAATSQGSNLQDGHTKPNSDLNPVLVAEKRKLLNEKQRIWEMENPTAAAEQLN